MIHITSCLAATRQRLTAEKKNKLEKVRKQNIKRQTCLGLNVGPCFGVKRTKLWGPKCMKKRFKSFRCLKNEISVIRVSLIQKVYVKRKYSSIFSLRKIKHRVFNEVRC
jgi:hypothetical protein